MEGICGWMDVRMDGCADGWMCGCAGGWMDELKNSNLINLINLITNGGDVRMV